MILVETVGVGQSETMVADMTDYFLALMLAGAGDELQGIKRGIMEMADDIIINKADGETLPKAKRAASQIRQALHLLPPKRKEYTTGVYLCSSMEGRGITEQYDRMMHFFDDAAITQTIVKERQNQRISWLRSMIVQELTDSFFQDERVNMELRKSEDIIRRGNASPSFFAEKLLQIYFENRKS
jgi:LAO/AO transport system kinase